MIYLSKFKFPNDGMEFDCLQQYMKRTCYNTLYPFGIFSKSFFENIEFEPITIFYGGNGTGKSTALNVIADKAKLKRDSAYNKSAAFDDYVSLCEMETVRIIPDESRIITSDDVFDYILNIRSLNSGIDMRREELFGEYLKNKYSTFKMRSIEDYDRLKASNKAKSKSQSQYVLSELMNNTREYSNGESAFKYFTTKIKEDALYLLDEPENSLSPKLQTELVEFIENSARFYGCQFIISTHSPFILSMENARIYNLDSVPVTVEKWTELENVRIYYEFFKKHSGEFYSVGSAPLDPASL